jgi:hypothetical protein
MSNTGNKIRYSDKNIFIDHPLLLQKKESKKNNFLPQTKEDLQENDEKLKRRKSGKSKKCRRTRHENSLLKDSSSEVDKVFSEFKVNNIVYFYDEKDQKCVMKNISGTLCNVSSEQPKESEVVDSNYESMDEIGKNEFLMKEIGNKNHVDIVENTTTCIIL